MKKVYIILSMIVALTASKAQNKDTKTADKYFDRYDYVDAAKEYLKLANNGKGDSYVYKQIADCYYNVFNSIQAEKWYEKAIEEEQDAETYFRYAQMLKANGKYKEADLQMKKFATLAPKDKRAANNVQEASYLNKLLGERKLFEVNPLEMNSKYSDFGAFMKDSVIYFASGRNTARKTYEWNDEPFLDLYKTDYKGGKVNKSVTELIELNTKYHEGPVTISPDGNTIYFSRESFFDDQFVKSKDKKLKIGKMNIFKATNDNGKWVDITPLSFNSKEYNTSSPSLSKDGKTLYFISDMPGSWGKTDVWKISVVDNNPIGTPENLGEQINTEGNELSAFIADNNTLYFASNGRKGFGGLDIFTIDLNKKGAEAINLGKPINSEKDDFAFTFNQKQNVAFLSSNRDGGFGSDDIYLAIPVCTVNLVITTLNKKTGDKLPETEISVVDDKKNVVAKIKSNNDGIANVPLDCNKQYKLNADKEGYLSEVVTMEKSKGGEVSINAYLTPTEPIVTETEVLLSDINFEYNKSNITQQGATELDKLVKVMAQYPEMILFVKSHTDSKGNENYNMNLSQKRAKSTVQYLISKGISESRVTGQGFGETEPKVLCGENCTDEENELNRRSEFIIIKK